MKRINHIDGGHGTTGCGTRRISGRDGLTSNPNEVTCNECRSGKIFRDSITWHRNEMARQHAIAARELALLDALEERFPK